MNLRLRITVFAAALAILTPAVAAEPETMAQLDKALKAVATFEYGQDSGPLVRAEQIVVEAAKDAKLREAVEQRLLRTLDAASTTDAKSFLCRQLRTIGTARCVPQLEKLLTDPQLSHMARYALGRIEDQAAAAALHRALPKTAGKLQVGILNTLGERRYRQALPDIVRLLRSPDSAVAQASAGALGRIGGTQAAETLQAARAGASKALSQRIDNALLVCAEQLLADGLTNEAKLIYARFYSPEQPMHLRLAGLHGFVLAQGIEGVAAIMQALKDPDPELRRGAISLMTMAKGQDATRAFAEMLPSLPPDTQELVVRALGDRGDAAAAQAIAAATKSPDEMVRIAAVEALGSVGDASAVRVLAEAAAVADGREKLVARASLARLRADDTDATLIRSIGSGDAKVQAEIIHALAVRNVTEAKGGLLKAARDDNEEVRREAILALGKLGSESELDELVALAVRPKDAKDRSPIEQAINTVFTRVEDKGDQARPVLAALAGAPTDAKPTLLRLLSRPATPRALQAVRAALKDTNAEVVDAAVRTLSDWPDPAPADDLLSLARTSTVQSHKVLALRGYVRMAAMSKDPTAMYVRAMELADRPDDKKLVLGGLGSADSATALDLVEGYLKDKQLQAEAGLAAVQIADRLRQSDASRARAALENIVRIVEDGRVRQKAQDIINEMDQYEGYILTWLAAGPYTEKGKESRAIFDAVFPPEKPDAKDVKWNRLTQGIGSWDINLEATFGGKDHCGAYMKTRIFSPEEQDVRLEMGSDDAIKAWLNGKLVHANYQSRGVSPRQDLVKVRLRKGWNELLLKVVDHEGGWGFCCRVRKADGTALDGLKFEAN
jgi:HEAT repeat protein